MTEIILHIGKVGFRNGVVNAGVNCAVAWGTRFIDQIPTQGIMPAAIVGVIHSFTRITTFQVLNKTPLYDCIRYFFQKNVKHLSDKEAWDEITQEGKRTNNAIKIIAGLVGIVAASTVTPAIASFINRTISYKEAACFALISTLSTYAYDKLVK
mgnify:CR=1 FL=1